MPGLSKAQVEQFHEDGFLMVKGLFNPTEDLDPIIEEYKGVLSRLAQELYNQDKIGDTYADLSFGDRFIKICIEWRCSTYINYSFFFINNKTMTTGSIIW